jgi:ABC-type phosphate/phosphonate transport system substrate-binding protein
MREHLTPRRRAVCVWLIATTVLGATCSSVFAAETVDIRVGVLAYEDFADELPRYEAMFAKLARASSAALSFRLAVGTYGDLTYWLDRGHVDLAIVSPGVLAEGFAWDGQTLGTCRYGYVATLTVPAARSTFASPERRRAGAHERYHAICLVNKKSSIQSVDDLQQGVNKGRVRILMPDPLSISGRVAPLVAMKQSGVNIATPVHYTQSHSNSVRMLLAGESGHEQVAFVWDGVPIDDTSAGQLRQIAFAELEKLSIPSDVVVAREGFPLTKELQTLVASQTDSDFRVLADWRERYGAVRQWLADTGLPAHGGMAQQVTLGQLAGMLMHDARSQPAPPRIALVLSGGGAKCAYQVGAIAAIEEELAALRDKHPDLPIDIRRRNFRRCD